MLKVRDTVASEISFRLKCNSQNISFTLPRRFGVELNPMRLCPKIQVTIAARWSVYFTVRYRSSSITSYALLIRSLRRYSAYIMIQTRYISNSIAPVFLSK
jgi:hypothetical protein